MRFTVPDWLDETAKSYWRKHVPHLKDLLDERNIETFAVLCSIYSLVRTCDDVKLKKNYIDAYIRLITQFGLTPKSSKLLPKTEKPVAFFT